MRPFMRAFASVSLMLVGSLTAFSPAAQLGSRASALSQSQALSSSPILSALDPTRIAFQPVASGLSFPVFVTNAGDGSGRLFIVQQGGRILVFKGGGVLPTPFLDISGLVSNFTGMNGEQGLLCLVFDPHYTSNGFFYITYTTNTGDATFPYSTTLARYRVSVANPDLADTSSGMVILTIPKKFTNHNGGMLAFGPDGYLYMSMGDGGGGGDTDNNAQTLQTLLGKLLRLDVDATPPPGQTYVIPSTNPFFGSPDSTIKKEIWAYGLRNPWRFSFDRSTGDLYIGDVGQATWEEIDIQAAGIAGGQNYGWHVMEGDACYDPSTGCDMTGKILPVTVYDHLSGRCSVTGGYVYRGLSYPALLGHYFYGDFCNGMLYDLYFVPGTGWVSQLLLQTPYNISSFGQDENGELYLVDWNGGIYRLISTVTISGNGGVAGASLAYTDLTAKTAVADGSGNYSIKVPYGWTGTITPFHSGNSFTPVRHSYSPVTSDLTGQDFAAGALLFADVPVLGMEWMQPWIEQFFHAGITTGCGLNPLIYCPAANVTREEMAVFLLRAIHGPGYAPPNVTGIFADMPVPGKEWMEPWVDEFYTEGLTTGCGANPLIFCPEGNVTRADMAVFVLRATHPAGWTPPASTGIFADVPVPGLEWMQPWIEEYYREGITTGCGMFPLIYCPGQNTTRAEMAVFIDRAFHLMP